MPRVIARLDIKGPNLVKGIQFEGLRVLGKPEVFAKQYYLEGADELLYMDAVASLYGRNSLLDVVERTSKETFIPLTVGGGLRTTEDIQKVLRAGADKVCVNTAALAAPELISEAARQFGSSTVVVSIEAYRQANGRYLAYYDFGRQNSGRDVVEWALQATERGAGELLVTCVNLDGTGKGLAIELLEEISRVVAIPVIAGGGVGTFQHIQESFDSGHIHAVSLASVLHYDLIQRVDTLGSDQHLEGNVQFLHSRQKCPSRIHPLQLPQIKKGLCEAGVPCRSN